VTTPAARAVDRRFPLCAGPGDDDDDETPIGDPDVDDEGDDEEEDDDEGDTMWAGATLR